MESTHALFLKRLSAGDEAAIKARLQIGAREFWRVARGRKFIEREPAWVYLSLFDMIENGGQGHDSGTRGEQVVG